MTKSTSNDPQNTTQKTKDWATRTPSKHIGELVFSGRVCSSCSMVAPVVLLLNDTNVIWFGNRVLTLVYVNKHK
jgi:hypothetical protein